MNSAIKDRKMEEAIQTMEALFQQQKKTHQEMEKEFRELKRMTQSYRKGVKKVVEKVPRKPSGFALPVPVSPDLCKFLNIPEGSHISRTDVTKYLMAYIDQHHLIDPEKKTIVVPNEELARLLGPTVDLETLTRFTIQKYMNVHYGKIEKSPPI